MGLLITFLLGVFILAGALISRFTHNAHMAEQISVSAALGTITGLLVLELIPEAWESISGTQNTWWATALIMLLTAGIGVALLKVLDMFIPEHDHAHGLVHHCSNENTHHIGVMAAVAVILHNLIEGMAVYSVSANSLMNGLMMAIGVGLHNIPMGMMIWTTLIHERKRVRWSVMLVVAFSTFTGGLLMALCWSMISEAVIGIMISLTIGMLVYIAVFELLPHVLHARRKGLSAVCAAAGLALIILSRFLE